VDWPHLSRRVCNVVYMQYGTSIETIQPTSVGIHQRCALLFPCSCFFRKCRRLTRKAKNLVPVLEFEMTQRERKEALSQLDERFSIAADDAPQDFKPFDDAAPGSSDDAAGPAETCEGEFDGEEQLQRLTKPPLIDDDDSESEGAVGSPSPHSTNHAVPPLRIRNVRVRRRVPREADLLAAASEDEDDMSNFLVDEDDVSDGEYTSDEEASGEPPAGECDPQTDEGESLVRQRWRGRASPPSRLVLPRRESLQRKDENRKRAIQELAKEQRRRSTGEASTPRRRGCRNTANVISSDSDDSDGGYSPKRRRKLVKTASLTPSKSQLQSLTPKPTPKAAGGSLAPPPPSMAKRVVLSDSDDEGT
jgi:hypothetical protein